MNRKLKVVGIVLASAVLGGVLGWAFQFEGYEIGVTVAIILALFSTIEPISKKKVSMAKNVK